jgi:hypothetical protein
MSTINGRSAATLRSRAAWWNSILAPLSLEALLAAGDAKMYAIKAANKEMLKLSQQR